MFAGKCPGCQNTVNVKYKAITITESFGSGKLRGVSYCCNQCDTILGVDVDPYSMMTDISDRVAKRLGRR